MTVGGQTLKVRAYSVQTEQGIANPPVGQWITADLLNYTNNGFAIKNRVGSDANELTGAPEHAVDNNEVVDVLVFELPSGQNWDIEQFQLGWAQEGTIANKADVAMWMGGNAGVNTTDNYDFSAVCFSGCVNTLGNLGFTRLDTAGGGTAFNGEDVGLSAVNVGGTQTGRYVIMTGQLGETNDYFKVKMLKASGTPGGGSNPEPGTLALLGLGFVGLWSLRRRPARA